MPYEPASQPDVPRPRATMPSMDAVNDPTQPSPDTGTSPGFASKTEPESHHPPAAERGPGTRPDQQDKPPTVHPDGVRIAVVIADVHGRVRSERFEKSEVSIGRDSTNDLVLVADGVSREHVVLTVNDEGSCLIIDLGSTNGTFVNHRNIERAPTKLHERDQVAIGELALRVRGYAAPIAEAKEDPTTLLRQIGEPEGATRIVSRSSGPMTGPGMTAVIAAQKKEPEPIPDDGDELTCDGSEAMASAAADASASDAPPADEPDRPADEPNKPADEPDKAADEPDRPADGHDGDAQDVPAGGTEVRQVGSWQPRLQELVAELVEAVTREVGAEALRTHALDADTFEPADGATLSGVDAALDERLGSLPSGAEREAVRLAARHQLLGLGPLVALMRDPTVERIRVLATRAEALGKGRWASDELDYASTEAARWALSRLLRASGGQPETTGVVKLELPHGWTLHAIAGGPAAAGPMFELVRMHGDVPSLRDLCLDGALSPDMAAWIESALARRANLLIACERHSGAETLTRAVAAAVPNPEQTLWLAQPGTATPDGAVRLSLDADPSAQEEAVAALEEISCPHLVAPFLAAKPFAALSQLTLRGRRGVLATCWGHTLEAAIELASAALMDARPAVDRRAAHARLAAGFDVAMELRSGADGRLRFMRLAELQPADEGTQVRDVFRFSSDETGFRAMAGNAASRPPTTDRSA